VSETGSVRLANWHWTSVGELGDVSGGITKNSSKTNLPVTLPYLRVANVYANELRLDDIAEIGVTKAESARALLVKGDLLVVEGNGSIDQVGRVAVWSGRISPCLHQNHLIKVRFSIDGLERFILYWLLSPDGRERVVRAASSTSGLHTLSLSKVASLPAPVAPLPEQHRIVEAIESYFTRLDDAMATLELVQRKLKRYRASVLKAAVEGRLVPTEAELARAEGRDYEPASVLLERILAERRRCWQETGGRGKYREPDAPDTTDLLELPEGWCWVSLGQLLRAPLINGRSVPGATDGFPVLRLTALKGDQIDLTERKTGRWTSDEARAFLVSRGDFLVARGNGSIRLVGRGGLVTIDPDPVAFPDTLIRVRVDATHFSPRLLAVLWNSPLVRIHIERRAKTTAGIHKVNQTDLELTPIPLPPRVEQERLLAELDKCFSVGDETFGTIETQQRRCARLRQSTLKWAFEGKLADQDPSDEPASALLERIRSQTSASRQSASDADDGRRRRSGRRSSVRAGKKP